MSYSNLLHSIALYAERVMPRFGRTVGAGGRPFRSSGGRGVRRPPVAPRSLLAIVALLASPITPADDIVARSLCDAPPHDQLCAVAPKDNTDFDAAFIYLNLEKNAQNPFDIFSWQTFVALNWPADEAGAPIAEPIGTRPDLPRVWQSWKQPAEVFGLTGEDPSCRSDAAAVLATDMILQSNGLPLIDRDLNYVVFDTRMNDRTERYIVANGLDSVEGQRRFRQAGKVVDFPRGHYRGHPHADRRPVRGHCAQDLVEDHRRWRERGGRVVLHHRRADRGAGGSERDRRGALHPGPHRSHPISTVTAERAWAATRRR